MKQSSIIYSLKSIINLADKILIGKIFWSDTEELSRGSDELKDFFKKYSTDKAVLQVIDEIPDIGKPREQKNVLINVFALTIGFIFAFIIFFITQEGFECCGNNDSRYQIQEVRGKYALLLLLIEDGQL
jgi:hypothetical protein